jgi:hypothetical protein
VTVAEHGVSADPLKVTFVGHVIVVVDAALSTVKLAWVAVLVEWFASPAKPASAVAVPALTLFA